ncbi:AAA family ATPase [Streptomyces sp. XM83C]|uniref:AAA family ATPase n=2 Tax=Streptomyces thermocoprophilus TaxID=78356 RepID=A0ABV5VFX0_9ACTN|nr:AAA family ATPase [Streptomyces sp. XM83C]MCK1823527.1 AAA family ATPase [Streptomyces sp. XM83C]
MTAPLTPRPHDQSQHPTSAGPAGPAGYGYPAGPHGVAYGQDGPGMKTELREGAVVAVAVAVLGVLLGVLWWWLAPHVPRVGDEVDGTWYVYAKDPEGEQVVAVDGTFTLLALAFGLVSAVAVFAWRRRGGVPLVVGLGLGSLLGAVLAWRVGMWLGPTSDLVAHAKEVGKGVTFSGPLELNAKAALLAWPLGALLAHLGLTALFGVRDPDEAAVS